MVSLLMTKTTIVSSNLRINNLRFVKSRSQICVFVKYFLYLQCRINNCGRHNQEAFSYSVSVNLDNSLNVRTSKRRNLRFVYMYLFYIYSTRCERLFLFNIRAVESLQIEYVKQAHTFFLCLNIITYKHCLSRRCINSVLCHQRNWNN